MLVKALADPEMHVLACISSGHASLVGPLVARDTGALLVKAPDDPETLISVCVLLLACLVAKLPCPWCAVGLWCNQQAKHGYLGPAAGAGAPHLLGGANF